MQSQFGFIGVRQHCRHVYCTSGHNVETSDLIRRTHMHKRPRYTPVKCVAYMAYICNLVSIFVSGTYMAVTCEVDIGVG